MYNVSTHAKGGWKQKKKHTCTGKKANITSSKEGGRIKKGRIGREGSGNSEEVEILVGGARYGAGRDSEGRAE